MKIKVESHPFVSSSLSGIEITLDWGVYKRDHWFSAWELIRNFQTRETALEYARLLRYPTVVML